jgi:hypothetical protein
MKKTRSRKSRDTVPLSHPCRDNILRGMGAYLLCGANIPPLAFCANPLYCTTASRLQTVSGKLYLAGCYRGRCGGPTLAAEGRYEIIGSSSLPNYHCCRSRDLYERRRWDQPKGANVFFFSVVFSPPPSSHHDSAWLLPVISLFLTNTASPGAGLPIHMMGEVS